MEGVAAVVAGRFAQVEETQRAPHTSLARAVDRASGRPVSLRILRSSRFAADPAAAIAFREAVNRSFAIAHRTIAGPIDVDVDAAAGFAWVAYDPLPPTTFADLRRARPADRVRPLSVLASVADALAAARASSGVHGALHPHAIHVSSAEAGGRVMITDVELGPYLRVAAIDHGVRDAELFAYAAPELLRAPASRGTSSADVYSIAATAYEVLGGRRPRLSTTLDALLDESRSEPPDLRAAAFGVPLPLATLIMRALATDPSERPSIREIAAGLHAGANAIAERELPRAGAPSEPRDATVVVERADVEAALDAARSREPASSGGVARMPGDGVVFGLATLALATFVGLAWRPDADVDARLSIATHALDADGGVVPNVRAFVDGRFRGTVTPDDPRDVAVTRGRHRVDLRLGDGGLAATASVDVEHAQRVSLGVASVDAPDDPAAIVRHAAEDRFTQRCSGDRRGTLQPGRTAVTASIDDRIDDGRCGRLMAGRMGEGPLENCAFDGEYRLLAEVTLRRGARFAVQLTCRPDGALVLLQPRARADLVPDDGGSGVSSGDAR